MFNVKHNECVGFESKWKVKKVSTNSTSQTTEFSVSEKGCNTADHKSQEVQTDAPDVAQQAEVDMVKLAQWLNKIYPKVKEQIDRANNSKVFRNYRLMDDPVDSTCKLVQTLHVANKEDKAIPIVTCLEWNSSGKSLAVAYSFKHQTWCYHTGVVCVYLLTREDVLLEAPKKRLSTESCVTNVKYHSVHNSILAAATFTGHIYVWNTENDVDPLICNVVAHDEYITQISWVQDVGSTRTICLASSSTDGLLKMWNFNLADNVLLIKSVYKIKTPVLGIINQTTEVPKSLIDKGDLGIACFDFSIHIPDMFVVAMEGGLIVRCSVLGVTKIKGSANNLPYYDPVFKYYEPHKGEIASIRFSLHRKDMFLTNGTDGEIRMYLLNQDDPAQVIFTKSPLNDISFVLHEERLLAGCSQNGTLEVYDLVSGKLIALTFNEKVTKGNVTSFDINSFKTNYVVLGNNNGEVQLWNIPWQNIEYQHRRMWMSPTSSSIVTTYSQDERIHEYLEQKRNEVLEEEDQRKQIFEEIFESQEHQIFKIPGVNIMKFTHKRIKFCFQPSLIYESISQTYMFYCSLRYLEKYKKWIIKTEPMPARPMAFEVTCKNVFIHDNLTNLHAVILRVYLKLKKWSEGEIRYRRDKYERYKKGILTYLDIDSVDEELYFSDNERQALFEKRNAVLRRMIPPLQKPKVQARQRKTVKYVI